MQMEIARPIEISRTAPELPSPMISRRHLARSIAQILDSSTNLVCVEGPQGSGKTVFLREFADIVNSPCFVAFLSEGSRHSYDPVMARVDLFCQANWFLNSRILDDRDDPTDGDLLTLWSKCAQRLNRSRERAYIIVDGLHHIPRDDSPIREAILSLLPFGIEPFRFLLSGDIDRDVLSSRPHLAGKPFQMSSFSSLETREFLGDLVKDDAELNKYHVDLGGVPSLLASARRQLLVAKLQPALSNRPSGDSVTSQFEAEWALGGELSDLATTALSIILAHGSSVDTPVLSKNCESTEEAIEHELHSLSFVTYCGNPSGWTFVSESYRQQALKKLSEPVQKATEKIIESLLEAPDSDSSLKDLPLYLEKIEKSEKLLTWLSEERLAAILHKTHSTARIEPTLRKAITLSQKSKDDLALTTYAILRSTIQQVSNTSGMDHEIRARIALGDFDGARAITNNVPLTKQRLRLLAVMAHSLAETPGGDPQPLLEQIRELCAQINFSELRNDEAIDIAIVLYPIDAELSLKILKETTREDFENSSFETAVAKITLTKVFSRTFDSSVEGGDSKVPEATEILVEKKLRELLEVTRIAFSSKSAEEVLDSTSSMQDITERLYVQRKWLAQNPISDDSITIIESAIHDAISLVSGLVLDSR